MRSADLALSFRELDQRANQLAHHLRRAGVGRDDRVALLLPRSLELAVAMLATVEAGGACVPLDPSAPRQRIAYLLSDSRPRLVICAAELAGLTGELPALVLEPDWWDASAEPCTRPAPVNAPDDLACVLYSSGSTGRPNGVAMPHRALSTLLKGQLAAPRRRLRRSQCAALSVEASLEDMFATWCSGGTLVVPTEAVRRDPVALLAWLAEQRIERIYLPVADLQRLAEAAREPAAIGTALREVIASGRRLVSTPALRAWFARCHGRVAPTLIHRYCPGEAHAVTAQAFAPTPSLWPVRPPVGTGIDGVTLRVLDGELRPVPAGRPGELFVGGDALARGYLGRPALTAARFVPDPLGSGARLYRTGDRVRRRDDGALELVGGGGGGRGRGDRVLELVGRGDGAEPEERQPAASLPTRALPAELVAALREAARREQRSALELGLALYALLLARYSGQDEVVVGVAASGGAGEGAPGRAAAPVSVPVSLAGSPSFAELLARSRAAVLGALGDAEGAHDAIVAAVTADRAPDGAPLCLVLSARHEARGTDRSQPPASFDLSVRVNERGELLELSFGGRSELLGGESIERQAAAFARLARHLASGTDTPVDRLPLVDADDYARTVGPWNAPSTPIEDQRPVPQLVADRARQTPDALAVADPSTALSYGELERRANRIANLLLSLGVRRGDRVALWAERSAATIAAIYGIAKAGAAYLPVDITTPIRRLEHIVGAAGVRVCFAPARATAALAGRVEVVLPLEAAIDQPDTAPGLSLEGDDLAYVIYTSGSTGAPKGVELVHQGLRNAVGYRHQLGPLRPGDRHGFFNALGFDVSTLDLWSALSAGASLHIPDDDTRLSPERLRDWIVAEKLTVAHAPTPLAELLVSLPWPRDCALRCLVTSGDRLRQRPRPEQPFTLINAYGPTECSVDCTAGVVAPAAPGTPARLPSIGRPTANAAIHILDDDMQPVPIGAVAELYIGGPGVGRGYLGQPALTAERFVPDPFAAEPGRRLYRSGDLCRYLPDGRIDFLGRRDHQVKIRGFRIELGEIEAVLAQHAQVREVVVVAREAGAGDRRLVAYVVPSGPGATTAALREHAGQQLPAYMVPQDVVLLEALPRTSSGKLDRKALPAPSVDADQPQTYVAPRTAAEGALAAIWGEVLGRTAIGVKDDFFALGGHSLLAMRVLSRLRAQLGADLGMSELFAAPTVAGLAARLDRAATTPPARPPLVRVARRGRVPLSHAQEQMFTVSRLSDRAELYNLAVRVRVDGRLEVARLEQALAALVHRHEALRTAIAEDEAGPHQVVADSIEVPLAVTEVGDGDTLDAEVAAFARAPFDLERGPLFRAQLVRAPEGDVLVLAMHHIVSDGWSLDLLFRDLAALYDGDAARLPATAVQYADFALWQRQWLDDDALAPSLERWRRRLRGAPPLLTLPWDRPRPLRPSHAGEVFIRRVPDDLAAGLRDLARRESLSLYQLGFAICALLLARYSGQDEVVVGTVSANRSQGEVEATVGYFAAPLPVRVSLAGAPSCAELLTRARSAVLDALGDQHVPLERIVTAVNPERSPSYTPLFQTFYMLEREPHALPSIGGLPAHTRELSTGTAKFDLSLLLADHGDAIDLAFEYSTELFEPATVERMASSFEQLARHLVANRPGPVTGLPLLDTRSQQRLVQRLDHVPAPPPRAVCAHELIEHQVSQRPDQPAVVDGDDTLSFAELDARANQLAHHLRHRGIGPGATVALLLARSPLQVCALLGVLKAGAAYVPLDPDHPAERVALLLEDCQPQLVLCAPEHVELCRAGPVEIVDDAWWQRCQQPRTRPAAPVHPDDLAYVIYTSGSTGLPKGAMIAHRALCNYLDHCVRAYGLRPGDRVPVHSPLAFDLTVTSLLAPLAAGARIELVPDGPGIDGLAAALARSPRLVKLTPAHLRALQELSRDSAASLTADTFVIGGEALGYADLVYWRRRFPATRLINEYGPTETVVGCCVHEVSADDPGDGPVPIGRPIGNLRLYLLDDSMQPVPAGVVGELYIGGAGVGVGYLRRPRLTAERFVPDPFASDPGQRLYRSGDRGRYRGDGRLEFLGRVDDQVKLRGFRIELGEVEAALASHDSVRQCVALVQAAGPGDERLVAYVVADGEPPAIAALREHCARGLPRYMVPSAIGVIDRLPLTPNGKVDRRALPPLAHEHGPAAAPETLEQELLHQLWCDLLGTASIGVDVDFFAAGGHSLLMVRMLSRLRARGVELSAADFFAAPTIRGLAVRMTVGTAGPSRPPLRPRAGDGDRWPLSPAQAQILAASALADRPELYNVHTAVRVDGHLDRAGIEGALSELWQRHEALRTRLGRDERGPFQHLGAQACFLAFEQLASAAELERRQLAAISTPFDLEGGPLFRAHLFRLPEHDVLVLVMHHIVSDAWSLEVLVEDLAALYRGEAVAPPPVQLADHALWQQSWLDDAELARLTMSWRQRLAGAPALLTLPGDRPRPAAQSHAGRMWSRRLPRHLAAALRQVARRQRVSLHQLGLALYAAVLGRYSGQDDLVIGTPSANRSDSAVERTVGFFVATLPVRVDLSGAPHLAELLGRAQVAVLEALRDQDLPFEKLVRALNPERALSHSPIFQVFFAYEHQPERAPSFGDLEATRFEVPADTSKLDVSLFLRDLGDALELHFEYSTDLFEASSIERLADSFEALARHLVAGSTAPVHELPLVEGAARQQLVEGWNATDTALSDPRPVPALVAERTRERPDALAVADPRTSLTYDELDRRANRIAHHLLALGVRRGDRVAVWAGRSAATIATIVGIAKSGAAYLPVDISTPVARVEDIAAAAGVRVCFAPPGKLAELAGAVELPLSLDAVFDGPDTPPAVELRGDDLACAIYTSGSTGAPKGVELVHHGLRNTVELRHRSARLSADDRHTFVNSPGFGVATLDLWSALAAGASLHIPDDDTRLVPERLRDWMLARRITVAYAPTPLAELLVGLEWPGDCALRLLFTSGDRLRYRPRPEHPFVLVNAYGPTECSVDCTACTVEPAPPGDPIRPPPIGKPMPNARVYILDHSMQPVPVGVVGELYIGGAGVGRGYLGQPALTAERFVPDPFGPAAGQRLYRSGDLCRYLPDGNIDFIGRRDHQVKIRGVRIELGEIEAVLSQHDGVREVVVVVRDLGGDDLRLVAYVVAGAAELTADALRQHAAAALPPYMVPAEVALLESLPRTASGKIDRKALPAPPRAGEAAEAAAPETDTERALHAIWSELLGVGSIGLDTDFFAAGGHSLLVMRALSRIGARLGVELSVRDFFSAPTIRRLAARIDGAGGPAVPRIEPADRSGRLPLSRAQEQIWAASRLADRGDLYNVCIAVRVDGHLELPRLKRALSALVACHEALRTTIRQDGAGLSQVVAPPGEAVLDVEPVASDAEAGARIEAAAAAPFDLERGPLFCARLYRSAQQDVLLLAMHHVVSDRWSLEILLADLAAFYGAEAGAATPAPPAIQYADYAIWQRRWLAKDELERRLQSWRQRLAGAPARLPLPTDRPRPPVQSHDGATIRRRWPPELAAGLRAAARNEEVSLYQLGFALTALLLARRSGQQDLVIGTLSANRNHPGVERTVGYFVNPVPVRIDLSGVRSFGDVLARTRGAALDALADADVPLDDIVAALKPSRSPSYTPLFQVLYSLDRAPSRAPSFAGLAAEASEPVCSYAKLDLSLSLADHGDELDLEIEYATALFDAATIASLADEFESLARSLIASGSAAGFAIDPEELGRRPLHPALATIDRSRPMPLSRQQEQVLADALATPGGLPAVHAALRLTGHLDVPRVQSAFERLALRHEALRTRITRDAAGARQSIAPAAPAVQLEELASGAELHRRLAAVATAPFEVDGGALCRACLLRTPAQDVLLLVLHPLVCDRASLQLLMADLAALYGGAELGAPPLQPADHAAWQRRWLGDAELAELQARRRRRLAGAPALLSLPWDRPRPAALRHAAGLCARPLPAPLASALRALAAREGVSLERLGLALHGALLSRYSGQDDVVVGVLSRDRPDPGLARSAGPFATELPVRLDLAGRPRLGELIARAGAAQQAAAGDRDLPGGGRTLATTAEPAPANQVGYAYERVAPPPAFAELGAEPIELATATTLDLMLRLRDRGDALELVFEHSRELFAAETIEAMAESCERLAAHLAAEATAPVAELPLLAGDSHRRIVRDWNATARAVDDPRPVPLLVADQARARPDALAVADPARSLTYAELHARANQVANHLLALGVRRGERVLVWSGRSAAAVAVIVGVARAGAAYLPVDVTTPTARVSHIARAAGVRVGFAPASALADLESSVSVALRLDAAFDAPATEPEVVLAGDDLAYVIFTSGSTGTPKGVELSHAGLRNAVAYRHRALGMSPADGNTLLNSLAFDIATLNLWAALSAGASLHLADEDTRLDPERLRDWIIERGLTIADVPAPITELLLRLPWPARVPLRYLVTGGDRLRSRPPPALPFALVNEYGPTETTIDATACEVEPGHGGPPPIGRPIDNVTAYVLDDVMQPVPVGVVGELYIGGAGVARGYLGRAAQTAERFVPDPFSAEPGKRLYRSGDLCRYRADGNIDFIGRRDHQVKVRGFRIELGEIEAVLARHPLVREVAVLARNAGGDDARLVAYVVASEPAPPSHQLLAHAAEHLPAYMVPADLVFLDALPLSAAGKIDRKALPEPPARPRSDGPSAPRSELEARLHGLWTQLLPAGDFGVDDGFFELGGNSLLAIQLVARLREELEVDVPVSLVFEHSTVAALAAHLSAATRSADSCNRLAPIGRRRDRSSYPPTLSQRMAWCFHTRGRPTVFDHPYELELIDGPLDLAALEQALREVVSRHPPLRSRFIERGGDVAQVIVGAAPVALERVDLVAALPEASPEQRRERGRALAAERHAATFDLRRGPLLRALAIRTDADEHLLLIVIQHSVFDGYSFGPFADELWRFYARARGEAVDPPEPLPCELADVAAWQREFLNGPGGAEQIAYWRQQLAGCPPLCLPTTGARQPEPPLPGYRPRPGASTPGTVPQPLAEAARTLAERAGVSPYMLHLAALSVLLARRSGQDDFCLFSPYSHRDRPETTRLIGYLANPLLMRMKLGGAPSFAELLQRTRHTVLGAFDHPDLPLGWGKTVHPDLPVDAPIAAPELYRVAFNYTPQGAAGYLPSALRARPLALAPKETRFEQVWFFAERPAGIRFFLHADSGLFSADAARALVDDYLDTLSELLADPQRPLPLG